MLFVDHNAGAGQPGVEPQGGAGDGLPECGPGGAGGAGGGNGADGHGCGGWDLIQRDWSLRQREPARLSTGLVARLATGVAARLAAVVAWAARAIRAALRSRVQTPCASPMAGGGSGTPRSSGRRP